MNVMKRGATMEFNTSIYDTFMYGFEKSGLEEVRRKIIPRASGTVLEIGPGTGVNLDFYDFNKIENLTLLEPDFNTSIVKRINNNNKINLCKCDTQEIPYDDKSFDTVVFTLVFCSVDDPLLGFNEINRVLKDDGQFIFIEHVEPKDNPLKFLFNKLNPLWNKIASGCNLNRNTLKNMEEANLRIDFHEYLFKRSFVYGYGGKNK